MVLLVGGCAVELEPPITEAVDRSRAGTPVVPSEPTPGPEPPPADARLPDGVEELLEGVAAAFLAADPDALRPWLADPDGAFGSRWLERATNLAGVPLRTYELEADPTTPDLATAAVRDDHGERAMVVHVRERHAIEGFDDDGGPVEDLFLTVVPSEEGWRVVGDRDAEALGLSSVRHVWDEGPVTVTVDGPFAAVHHPDTPADVATLLAEARIALDEVRERWPVEWSERVPLIVPTDQDELGRLLNVTFDLSQFIAFATGTPDGELGRFRVTGARVVINPDRFLGRPPDIRRSILAHELLHVATRPVTGPLVPSWLEEGVAQRLGEDRSTTGTDHVDAAAARGALGRLPLDSEFTAGGTEQVYASYQWSWSFVSYLVDRFGTEAVGRFYVEAGRGAVGEPGRRSYHLERASRRAFGVGFGELVAGWTGG